MYHIKLPLLMIFSDLSRHFGYYNYTTAYYYWFLGATRSIEPISYSNVAWWLSVTAVCLKPRLNT